jgi:hypothetical protein
MQKYKDNKPKTLRLEQIVPDGQVVNRKWLYKKGYERSSIDYYLRSGKLESVARGVYRRPGPPLKWQHLFYSLCELGYAHHIGGKSALDLQGYTHYLSLGNKQKVISLFGDEKLPSWINEIYPDIKFISFAQKGFVKLPDDSFTTIPFGHWDWELKLSSVELALFELLSLVKDETDFLIADKYFESATILKPKLLNTLLQTCTHIQTKRLFLWFSDRHSHQWSVDIDRTNIELGSGKRAIIKGGVLDKRYNITVPKEMIQDEQLLF